MFHCLEPPRKGVIAKMTYPILAYSREWTCGACPIWNIFFIDIKMVQNILDYTLTNTFGLIEFGSVMKKLWRFYPKHLILTSFRTRHKPYFPQSVTPKIQRPTSWFLKHRYLDMFSHFHRNFRIWIIIEKNL